MGRWPPNPHRTRDANEREWRWLPNLRQKQDTNERVAGGRPTLIECDMQMRGGSNWNILIERDLRMRRMWLAPLSKCDTQTRGGSATGTGIPSSNVGLEREEDVAGTSSLNATRE